MARLTPEIVEIKIGDLPEAWAAIKAIVAENQRLEGLIAAAEESGCKCGSSTEPSGCPWCNFRRNGQEEHDANCPAFSARGVVRTGEGWAALETADAGQIFIRSVDATRAQNIEVSRAEFDAWAKAGKPQPSKTWVANHRMNRP